MNKKIQQFMVQGKMERGRSLGQKQQWCEARGQIDVRVTETVTKNALFCKEKLQNAAVYLIRFYIKIQGTAISGCGC